MNDLTAYPTLTPDQAAFWQRFQDATGETAQGPRYVDAFADTPDLQDELAALVMARRKRATATLARWFTPQTLPQLGDLLLVLDSRQKPVCVVRTTHVRIGPVSSVTEEEAFEEGEGDRTRETWLTDHRAFFQREAAREGFDYADMLDVVFERFECVWAG